MEEKITDIEIDKIIIDQKYYPRIKPNWMTVYSYQQAMKLGNPFPPIDVAQHDGHYILIDGAHRLEANRKNKARIIACRILKINEKDFFKESVKCNINNALPFSVQEKRMIVVRLRSDGLKDKQIAQIIKMPEARIERFMAGSFVKTNFGDVIVKAPLKFQVNKNDEKINEIESEQKVFNARSQIQCIEQVIKLLENNWININNEIMLNKLLKLKDLIEKIL